MAQMAQAAGKGCAKSTANLIAAAKKSEDPKMVALAEKAEGGCAQIRRQARRAQGFIHQCARLTVASCGDLRTVEHARVSDEVL